MPALPRSSVLTRNVPASAPSRRRLQCCASSARRVSTNAATVAHPSITTASIAANLAALLPPFTKELLLDRPSSPPEPAARSRASDRPQGEAIAELQAALAAATAKAHEHATDAQNIRCLARALEHTNRAQQSELRTMRKQATELNLRIIKLKANPAAFDVPTDPSIERDATAIVNSLVVRDLEYRLALCEQENIQLRAQLRFEKDRADACAAAAAAGQRSA